MNPRNAFSDDELDLKWRKRTIIKRPSYNIKPDRLSLFEIAFIDPTGDYLKLNYENRNLKPNELFLSFVLRFR